MVDVLIPWLSTCRLVLVRARRGHALDQLAQNVAPHLVGHEEADDPETEASQPEVDQINDVHEMLRGRSETCARVDLGGRPF